MNWNGEYSVGIHEIDEQHRALADCIASIERAVIRYDRRSADAAVVRLAGLAHVHFTVEESLMRIHDYPRLEDHADDHRQFSAHLKTLQEPFLTTDAFRDRVEILHAWWDTHVQRHDKSHALHILGLTALGTS